MITATYCGRIDGPRNPHGWGVLPTLRRCPGRPVRVVSSIAPLMPIEVRRSVTRLSAKYRRAEMVGAR